MAGLASRLAARHTVTLLTLDDPATDRYGLDPRVNRVGLALMSDSRSLGEALRNNWRRLRCLRRAVRDSRPNVVLSFCDKTNVLTLAACRPLSVPVVISEHTDPRHQPIGVIWAVLRRWHYPRAAESIALTDQAAERVQRWTGKRPAIIPPAVDPPAPHPPAATSPAATSPAATSPAADGGQPPASRSRYQWLAVGRLSPEKAFDRAIEAYAKLAPSFPEWSLAIAGEGPQRDWLQQLIDRLGIAGRARLLGWVADVRPLLQSSNAFVLTSRYEGFPVSLLEAMAAGLPCVAVDCESGPAEVIRHRQNGWLVPQDNPEALIAAMQQIMTDAELRRRLGDEARRVVDDYSWDAMVAAHEQVLQQAAGRRQ